MKEKDTPGTDEKLISRCIQKKNNKNRTSHRQGKHTLAWTRFTKAWKRIGRRLLLELLLRQKTVSSTHKKEEIQHNNRTQSQAAQKRKHTHFGTDKVHTFRSHRESHRTVWTNMDSHGIVWIRVGSFGVAWIRLNSNGFQLIRMESCGFVWIRMDSYGF